MINPWMRYSYVFAGSMVSSDKLKWQKCEEDHEYCFLANPLCASCVWGSGRNSSKRNPITPSRVCAAPEKWTLPYRITNEEVREENKRIPNPWKHSYLHDVDIYVDEVKPNNPAVFRGLGFVLGSKPKKNSSFLISTNGRNTSIPMPLTPWFLFFLLFAYIFYLKSVIKGVMVEKQIKNECNIGYIYNVLYIRCSLRS